MKYDEHGNPLKYCSRRIWLKDEDRELWNLKDYGNIFTLYKYEQERQKAKKLKIQREKEEEQDLAKKEDNLGDD